MNQLEQSFVDMINLCQCEISPLEQSQNKLIINALESQILKLSQSLGIEKLAFTVANIVINSKPLIQPNMLRQKINEIKLCIKLIPKMNYSEKNKVLDLLYCGKLIQCIHLIVRENDVKFITGDQIITTNRSHA
jgi:hypothetical protein